MKTKTAVPQTVNVRLLEAVYLGLHVIVHLTDEQRSIYADYESRVRKAIAITEELK